MSSSNSVTKKTNYRWIICSLLFLATTVNYLDRQVLSILQPSLSEEFGWTNSDYANITAVFQFVYAIAVIFVGRFVDKVGIRKGYVWTIAVWSLGAVLHAYAIEIGTPLSSALGMMGLVLPISVVGFMFGRLVLAVGESGNFPAAIKTIGEWFPARERALATGIFNSGANIGAILAPLTVPVIAYQFGWEYAFILVGIIGFVWIGFWMFLYKSPKEMLQKGRINNAEYQYINEDKEGIESVQDDEVQKVSWFKLLGYRQTWSFFFGKFLTDGVWWFFLFWLPAYLKAKYDVTGTELMLPLAVLYSMTMIGSIGGGWFPTFFINKGMETYKARMTAMLVIALFPLIVLLAQPLGGISMWVPVILIGVGCSAHQAWSANIYTTVSDMFPNRTVASITGIGTMAGGASGVIVSMIAGRVFDYYQSLGDINTGYTIVFSYCAVAYLVAWLVMNALVPKFRPVEGV